MAMAMAMELYHVYVITDNPDGDQVGIYTTELQARAAARAFLQQYSEASVCLTKVEVDKPLTRTHVVS